MPKGKKSSSDSVADKKAKAKANKPAEDAALDNAAAEAGEDTVVHEGEGTGKFFDGREVVKVLDESEYPSGSVAQAGFKLCKMSDGTTVHVPEDLL